MTGACRPLYIDGFDENLWSSKHLATVPWLRPFGPTETVKNGVTLAGEVPRPDR